MRAMGWGYTAVVVVIYFIQNIAFIGQNVWLSDWTNDAIDYHNITYPNWKRDTRIGVFGALGVAQGNAAVHVFSVQFYIWQYSTFLFELCPDRFEAMVRRGYE